MTSRAKVKRAGRYYLRVEPFGAVLYSRSTDRFYALEPGAYDVVLKTCPPARGDTCRAVNSGRRSRSPDLDSLVARVDDTSPVMFVADKSGRGVPDAGARLLPAPPTPLLINWLLTSDCPFDCVYCCAEDLRRKAVAAPDRDGIRAMARRLAQSDCLAVVLTGGEPLSCPHLDVALAELTGKKGIILDTSGYGLLDSHLPRLNEAGVHVRISLDSTRRSENDALRKAARKGKIGAQETALTAIQKCVEAGIPVSVQTVISGRNKDSLPQLLDLLCRLGGIVKWNLYLMLEAGAGRGCDCQPDRDAALKAAKKARFASLRLRSTGTSTPLVRVVDSTQPDSVILLAPDGQALTEHPGGQGKVPLGDILGEDDPFVLANRSAHAWRYYGWIPDGRPLVSVPLLERGSRGRHAHRE